MNIVVCSHPKRRGWLQRANLKRLGEEIKIGHFLGSGTRIFSPCNQDFTKEHIDFNLSRKAEKMCDGCANFDLYRMVTSGKPYSYAGDIPCTRCKRFSYTIDEYRPAPGASPAVFLLDAEDKNDSQ